MSVYMHPKKCICGYTWTMGVPDFQKKTFEVLDCACLLSVQTLLGWLGAFGTGDRCDAWYRRLVWSAVKGQPCQCNWGILWEIFNIMHCYCWLLSAISVYLRVTWEIMDRLLDILDIITAVKAEKRQFSIIISIVSKVAPKKKNICLGVKCAEKEVRWTHNFPHSPAWEIVPCLLHFCVNPRQMVVGTSTGMLQPFSSICSSQQLSLSLAVEMTTTNVP